MDINLGISTESRDQITSGLSSLLADSYTLYLKTHNYHWNVEGPMFNTLHQMFETQYTELALAVDGPADTTNAGTRKNCLDASQHAGLTQNNWRLKC